MSLSEGLRAEGVPHQTDTMPRGVRTARPPGTDELLKQLNEDFQRSKTEQIQRFLVDQESLNRKFDEYNLNSEDEEGSGSAGSDTESVYSQRMALYKARPESVLGGITLDQLFNNDDDKASNTSTTANFSDSDDEKHHGMDMYDRNRNLTQRNGMSMRRDGKDGNGARHKRNKEERSNGYDVSGQEKAPGRPEKKLLVRRHVRPRTATGITSVKAPAHENSVTARLGEKREVPPITKMPSPEEDRLPDATPRLRASAPAATRTRPKLEADTMDKDHVVERSAAARKSLLRESKTIASYKDAFITPASGSGGSKGMTVPDINRDRNDRSRPSYARVGSRAGNHGNHRDGNHGNGTEKVKDPRTSGISSGNTRLSQSRGSSSFQAAPDSRATRTVHRVGSTNVSSLHNQRDNQREYNQRDSSVESRASNATVLRMGESTPGGGVTGARREGFRGSTVRQSSRDRENRDRSRERRAGLTSTRTSSVTEAFHTQESTAAKTAGNRHVTVLKLPPLGGDRSDAGSRRSSRGVTRDPTV